MGGNSGNCAISFLRLEGGFSTISSWPGKSVHFLEPTHFGMRVHFLDGSDGSVNFPNKTRGVAGCRLSAVTDPLASQTWKFDTMSSSPPQQHVRQCRNLESRPRKSENSWAACSESSGCEFSA